MPPLRHIRRPRRQLTLLTDPPRADNDWQVGAPNHLLSPSPSACTTTSSGSSPPILTHLPFAPRSSHTRNRKEGHIPRPPNAFMVFRSWLWNKDNLKSIERDNRNVSRIAGRFWNKLSEAERAPFRSMADEAKARHAQLYPEYRYAPGSQKKHKVAQHRPQRTTDPETETEKCKKVADLLLGGITSCDLANYLDEDRNKVKPEGEVARMFVAEGSRQKPGDSPPRSGQAPMPAPQYGFLLPPLLATEDAFENTPTPGPSTCTPELVYPPGDAEEFVPIHDIPHLSLNSCDNRNDLMTKMYGYDDLPSLSPSHMNPGAHTVFAGIKPEAFSFADSCVLGAYTTNGQILSSSDPFTHFDMEPYASMVDGLVPLGSPVFSNPFEPSTLTEGYEVLLGTLDQLFGHPISPLTPISPRESW